MKAAILAVLAALGSPLVLVWILRAYVAKKKVEHVREKHRQ